MPSTFVNPTLTLLAVDAPSGFSLLVVVWLTNTSATAAPGCISAVAACTMVALVLTDFCLAAGVTICSVNRV